MSSTPPRWLNLPLPHDICKLIGTYLNPLDRMMVRHAHGAKFTCEYVSGVSYDVARRRYQCSAHCMTGNVCIHTDICARRHASMSKYCDSLDGYAPASAHQDGMCDWERFKILCARYGAVELFAYMATKCCELTKSHSCCRNIYATAVAYGQLEFLEALAPQVHTSTRVIPFHTDTGLGFCWSGIAVLDYVSARTQVAVYRHLRGRGAIVTHRTYDRAVALDNMQLAAEIERDYTTCACGNPSPAGYYHCGNTECKRIRDRCNRARGLPAPVSTGTYQEIFRSGNIAMADTIWRKFAPTPYNVCESLSDCQYNPEHYTPDNVRNAVEWLFAHYEADSLTLSQLYMYAAGVKIVLNYDNSGDDTEYQRFREPDIPLIEYLIKQKIRVCDYVIGQVATEHLGVYRAVRNHIPINVNFAVGAISNNMMVFHECMREFGLPASKELLTALWRKDEYEEFAKLLLQFPDARRVVDIIRGH